MGSNWNGGMTQGVGMMQGGDGIHGTGGLQGGGAAGQNVYYQGDVYVGPGHKAIRPGDWACPTCGVNVFGSVGADGSVRMFDLRSLEHSTIIYESNDGQGGSPVPLIRLAWNKQDPNYLATITMDSSKVVILDIRVPSLPCAVLDGHSSCVNALAWAPHSASHVCTAGDDNQALIWDLAKLGGGSGEKQFTDPILAYYADAEVNQLQWSKSQPDWVAICFEKKLQILRV